MKNNINKSDFTFKQLSNGVYRVTYASPANSAIFWSRLITDMELIDATKNKDYPTRTALQRLKRFVKNLPARERRPVYKLSVKDGESDYLCDNLSWFCDDLCYFLERHGLTFIASHKRYNFPTNLKVDFDSFDSWEDIEKYLKKEGYKHIQPVYMLDHSMLAFSLNKFAGLYGYFDSGQIGFLASTKKGRKGQKAYKLYSEFLKDLQDFSNNFIQLVELTDENGNQIECIECFNNRLSENIKYIKKAYKNAKIVEID